MTKQPSDDLISPDTKLALADHAALQGLGSEEGGVLLNMDSGEMFTVNDTTLAFLQGVNGSRSITDIAKKMEGEYEVDLETLKTDLVEVATQLMEERLVVVVG